MRWLFYLLICLSVQTMQFVKIFGFRLTGNLSLYIKLSWNKWLHVCIHVHFYVVHVRSYICNFSLFFLTLTLCENVWKGNVIQVSSFRAEQIVYMQMKNWMSASHVNKAQVTASLQYGSWKFSGGKRSGPVLALARPYHRADWYSNILCHYKWQSCQHDASIISTFSIHVVEIYSARPFCILKF